MLKNIARPVEADGYRNRLALKHEGCATRHPNALHLAQPRAFHPNRAD
jgi:hypothetical protein